MNMHYISKLPTAEELIDDLPLSDVSKKKKKENDREIRSVITGRNNKFLLIIGPCSADRPDSVLDYCERLRLVQEKVSEKLLLIPRVYTSKPRTTGEGYMGIMSQPNPVEAPDIIKGIYATRKIHLDVLEKTGLPTADEMLYPEYSIYTSDLLSYITVGARSVENQQHRLTASGLDVAVGMKNPTSGDLSVLMNSVRAAQTPHIFAFGDWQVLSKGNPFAHVILRGHIDSTGRHIPNYHLEDLHLLDELYQKSGLLYPSVVVDTNHSNSGKDPFLQEHIALEVLDMRSSNPELKPLIKGLMIESYIKDGSQHFLDTEYGKSITDPCLGWEKTESLIYKIAEKIG